MSQVLFFFLLLNEAGEMKWKKSEFNAMLSP